MEINVDGTPFQATRNLFAALKRLRLDPSSSRIANQPDCPPVTDPSGTSRILWIDAICINQSDDDEKSHQVAMMGDIYGKAATGLLWLGEEPEQPTPAIDRSQQDAVTALLGMADDFTRNLISTYANNEFPELLAMTSSLESTLAHNTSATIPDDDFKIKRSSLEHWNKDLSHAAILGYHDDQNLQSDGVFQAFCLLKQLAADMHLHEIPQLKFEPDGQHTHLTESRRTLHWLFGREWWQRIWTVQECILPKTCLLMYGPAVMQWSMVLQAVESFQRHRMSCCSMWRVFRTC